jgi:hypothetical protein
MLIQRVGLICVVTTSPGSTSATSVKCIAVEGGVGTRSTDLGCDALGASVSRRERCRQDQ